MIRPVVWIFLTLAPLFVLQGLWSFLDGLRFLRLVRRSLARQPGSYQPPAAVIVPCKGLGPGFEVNVSAFLGQHYPAYQLIFVVASEADPAYNYLAEFLNKTLNKTLNKARAGRSAAPADNRSVKTGLAVAGRAETRGEKVNNLLRGLAAVEPGTEVLVFADADGTPKEDWLRALVAPLEDERVTVSTGFRWYLPGESFASQLRAAWDTSIATMLGEHDDNFAWGGSMAVRAADFKRLRVAERHWASTVSDDYALTRAVREAGGRIHFESRCLVKSGEDLSLGEFMRWANRQIIITRVYSPRLWLKALAFYVFYGATFLIGLGSLVLSGGSAAERLATVGLLLAVLAPGIAKARLRTVVAREMFPEEGLTLERRGARYWQLAPLVPWVMLLNFMVSAFARSIEWGGLRYELRSAREVRVVKN